MQVDYGFILAAGFGTRMGPIGTIVPKLLWPVFNKTLLDLQISYLKNLGIRKIYINAHFLFEELNQYILKNHKDVEVLFEESVFDIGGGIVNFANQVKRKGTALIINGDQFLFFNFKIISEALEKLGKITLFTIDVNSNEGYNQLIIEREKLKDIKKNNELERNQKIKTYSGMSLINLSTIQYYKETKLSFFDSVANYRMFNVDLFSLGTYEYWDFGTTERYLNSIYKLLDHKSDFTQFLKASNVIIPEKSEEIILNYKNEDFKIFRDRVEYKNIISKM